MPSESIYIRNQLKALSDQSSMLTTAELTEFFMKAIYYREHEKNHEMKKLDDQVKKLQNRHTSLTSTMERHRNNMNSLPVLLNSIIEDFLVQNEKEKSQELSINRGLSERSSKSKDVFLTAGLQEEKKTMEYFVHDFTTELYAQMDDDQRKELLLRFLSNKMLLFHFREFLLTKLEPNDVTGPSLIRGAKPRLGESRLKDSGVSSRIENNTHNRSRSIQEKESFSERRNPSHNKVASFAFPSVAKREVSRDREVSSKLNMTADSISLRNRPPMRIEDDSAAINMDVMGKGKRKILRYLVKKSGSQQNTIQD